MGTKIVVYANDVDGTIIGIESITGTTEFENFYEVPSLMYRSCKKWNGQYHLFVGLSAKITIPTFGQLDP